MCGGQSLELDLGHCGGEIAGRVMICLVVNY